VDGDTVPIPHFGAVLDMETFNNLAETLRAASGTDWIMEPKTRFLGEPGEQATMFVREPLVAPVALALQSSGSNSLRPKCRY